MTLILCSDWSMITREEYFNLSGVQDSRLSNPLSSKPLFRFGTIPNGATDFIMLKVMMI